MEYAPAIIFMQRTLSPRKDEEATAFTVLADFYPQSANMHSEGRITSFQKKKAELQIMISLCFASL